MLQLPSRYIRFGPFQVDQQRQEVTRNGTRLKLQGKVYQVLIALIEKQGDVVTREELRVRLWPAESQVNYDANVNTTVNKLRQALGDSSDKPLYIETVPRKGYCLIAQPEFAEAPLPAAHAPGNQYEWTRASRRQRGTLNAIRSLDHLGRHRLDHRGNAAWCRHHQAMDRAFRAVRHRPLAVVPLLVRSSPYAGKGDACSTPRV